MTSWVFDAIGTRWQIDIENELPEEISSELHKKIRKRIEEFDMTYSRFLPLSWVRDLSNKKGTFKLPDDAMPLFSTYEELYKLTKGKFTPLIGQLLSDAGYDEYYSFKSKELAVLPAWEDVIKIREDKIETSQPVLLDFGAGGKGYLVDILGLILEKNGIRVYTIDAGGDIRFRDNKHKMLRVGLENPVNTKQVIGVAEIINQSICGSSGNRRRWGNFHHIIDPFSKKSVESVKAVWVIADTTLLADSLSTCLFFAEPEALSGKYEFEYVIMYEDSSVKKSGGFKGELFLK